MTKRKGLTKKTRFEIFKRDSFTCQYCGAKAPDVVLQVDHVDPVANGGSNALINLVTSCAACNGGKGATPLDDSSMVEKQRRQMEELQARREQIDMMVDWQKGLSNIDDYAVEQLCEYWETMAPGWSVSDHGKKVIRKHLRTFSLEEVMVGMRIAAEQYLVTEGDPPKTTGASWSLGFGKIGGVCSVRRREADCPHIRRLIYCRAILKRRFGWCVMSEALGRMENATKRGMPVDEIESLAKTSDEYDEFLESLEMYFEFNRT